MRLLFSVRPFYGHFYPFVPLARAAQTRGHEVVFGTAAAFCPIIEAAGFAAISAGLHPHDELPAEFAGVPYGRDYGEHPVRTKTKDLVAYANQHPVDVIVRDPTDIAAVLAAELIDRPSATLGFSIYIPSASWDILVGDQFERLRAEFGLPPDPNWSRMHPYLYLDAVPPFFQVLAEPLPVCQPLAVVVDQGETPGAAVGWPASGSGRPLVHVSLGTAYNRRPRILRTLIEGAAALPATVLATVGPDLDPSVVWRDPPESVQIERFVPLSDVLARSDAIITAGGFNTVIGSICAGLPLVVVPLASDQPRNASRVVDLGVGRRLEAADLTADLVTQETRALLREPGYRVRAARLAELNRGLPSPRDAILRLERLADDRLPQLNDDRAA